MAEIKYNDYTINGVHGEFAWTFTGDSYQFTQRFAIYAADYAALKVAIAAMEVKLKQPYKDLKVKVGGTTFFETKQATHVGGYNCMPSVTKVLDESGGLHVKYDFTVTVNLPAGDLGGLPFSLGLSSVSCSVTEETSEVQILSFSGEWKVVDTSGDNVKKRYKDLIEATITAYYLTPYFATESFDKLNNEYEFDMKAKVIKFKLVTRERIFSYTGGGGTKYILKNLRISKSEKAEIGIMPKIEDTASGKKGEYVEKKGDNPTGENLKPIGSYTPPITFQMSGHIAFIKGEVKESAAVALYDSEIFGWLKGMIKSIYKAKSPIIEERRTSYDPVLNGLDFSFTAIVVSDSIKALQITIDDEYDNNYETTPIATAEDYTRMVYTEGKSRTININIQVTMINKVPNMTFFRNLIPKGINPKEKDATGWLYFFEKMTDNFKKRKTDKNVEYNTRGYVTNAAWLIVKVPTKADMRIKQRETKA